MIRTITYLEIAVKDFNDVVTNSFIDTCSLIVRNSTRKVPCSPCETKDTSKEEINKVKNREMGGI